MALVVDAGPLVAYVDADEDCHAASLELLRTHPGPLSFRCSSSPRSVHLIWHPLGCQAELRFLADLADGPFIIDYVDASDWLRIAQLVWRYRDLGLAPSTRR